MKPTDIIQSWETCAPVLQKPSAWVLLMRIAAAGDEGIRLTGASLKLTNGVDHRTMTRWERAGLIQIEQPERGGIKRGYIQAKGLRLLGFSVKQFQ